MDIEENFQAAVVTKSFDSITTTNRSHEAKICNGKLFQADIAPYYTESSNDSNKITKQMPNGRVIPIVEFKEMHREQKQQQQQQELSNRISGNVRPSNNTVVNKSTNETTNNTQSESNNIIHLTDINANSNVIQSLNRNQIQIQEGDIQKSARMLIVLHNDEQRLITFKLPQESCTVQELLKQVGVPFTSTTRIQCVPNPGEYIDYFVTVGITVQDSMSKILLAAENSLLLNRESSLRNLEENNTRQEQILLNQNQDSSKDVSSKLISGQLALCTFCGLCGYDHAKCERCKRVFLSKPERFPVNKNILEIEDEKKRNQQQHPIELFNKSGTRTIITSTNKGSDAITVSSRTCEKIIPQIKPAQRQPVILTLSSEDEADRDRRNKSTTFSPSDLNDQIIEKTPLPCEAIIKEINQPFQRPYNPTDRCEAQMDDISDESQSVIRTIFPNTVLEEILFNNANELLIRSSSKDNFIKNDLSSTINSEVDNIRQILIYPPGKGGISINTEDYMCLARDQYLNDVIIDFYLKYLLLNILNEKQKRNTHIFSSFFYTRLTTSQYEGDNNLSASQNRHMRVKSWTKNVNIFEKDYVIIPINEQSHWFLAIICFPGLKGPVTYDTNEPVIPQAIIKKKKVQGERKMSLQIGNGKITPLSKKEIDSVCVNDDSMSGRDEAEGDVSELAPDESAEVETEEKTQPIKQPLILIFDSLPGASRSRVVATLRDYLTCEYRTKVKEDSTHNFNQKNMPGHYVKVPRQNNFTDCGLYLLQYVEQFFNDPIKDYRLPIKQLVNWFEEIVVTRKRDEMSNLLRGLVEQYNPDRLPLPDL